MKLKTLTPATARIGAYEARSSTPPDLARGQRILVAEDKDAFRQSLANSLANTGFDVEAAANGEEAWQAVQRDHYDLLVTDNRMPHLTGLELSRRIRAAGMSLPIIMASGLVSGACVQACASLKIAVIPKPFAFCEVLSLVHKALQEKAEAVTACQGSPVSAPSPDSQPPSGAARPGHPQVLIVDDDPIVRGSLTVVLESEGYAVDEAGSGLEAVHRATQHHVDLVLLDLNMPHGDGWTTFHQLDQVTPLLPVIVITARPNQYEEAVRVGVDVFMEKPLNIQMLLRAIKRLTSESELRHISRITNRAFVTQRLASANSASLNHRKSYTATQRHTVDKTQIKPS